jgi:membrane protease YdiL (CAAX protease family)
MKKYFNIILFSKKGMRLIWPIATVVLLIIIGETIIVDPLSALLSKIGFDEVTGVLPANGWNDSIGDSIKRLLRTAVVVGSALLVLKYLLKKPPSYAGFTFAKGSSLYLLQGIGLGFVIQLISIALMYSFGYFKLVDFSWNIQNISFFGPAILYTIIICVETGFIEETIFRGFLLRIFESRYTTTVGVMVSSIAFGLIHFSGFNEDFPWWMSIISSLVTGLLFAQAFLLYGNLWLPIGLHAGWHFAMRTLGSVGLSFDEAIIMITEVDGPDILVSTRAGGAGFFELAGVVMVSGIMFIIRSYSKSRI